MVSPWFGVSGKESIHSSIYLTGVDVWREYRINGSGLQQMFTFLYRGWRAATINFDPGFL
jgi:hypothetical protein